MHIGNNNNSCFSDKRDLPFCIFLRLVLTLRKCSFCTNKDKNILVFQINEIYLFVFNEGKLDCESLLNGFNDKYVHMVVRAQMYNGPLEFSF